MSKSKGNVIYADDLVDIFGVDATRYYVLSEIPYDNDGSLTWELIIEKINTDLANTLGNLVNRTIAMENKYFNGVVTNPHVDAPVDQELKDAIIAMAQKVQAYADDFKIAKAIDEIMVALRRTNKYIDETTPWVLAKDESSQDRLATVLYNLIEAIRHCAIALYPYIPASATSILNQINTQNREFSSLDAFDGYEIGNAVTATPEVLFARLDPKEVAAKIAAIQPAPKAAETEVEPENQITIDDFQKVEFVVGTIEKCEKHPDAKKLLVSQINIGNETRQIVSGIASYYTPEELIGKKVIVVKNLKPAKLRGVESQGMILAGTSKKIIELPTLEKLPNGTKVS